MGNDSTQTCPDPKAAVMGIIGFVKSVLLDARGRAGKFLGGILFVGILGYLAM